MAKKMRFTEFRWRHYTDAAGAAPSVTLERGAGAGMRQWLDEHANIIQCVSERVVYRDPADTGVFDTRPADAGGD